jgi:hypothetical protein
LFKYLIKRFDELTIVDDFDEGSITNVKEYNALSRYINPNYWTEEIKGNHQEARARQKKHFGKLLKENDLLKTKTYLRTLFVQKFIQLINN